MRIAILSPFFPLRGGIAQFADAMHAAYTDQEVLAVSYSRQYPGLLFPGKSQFVDNPAARARVAEFTIDSLNPLSAHSTAARINEFNPDVVIVAYWMSFLAPILTRIVKRVEAKKIALVHNYISHEARFYDALLAKRLFQHMEGALCLSEAVKKQLQSHDFKGQVKVLPHPQYSHYGEKINAASAKEQLGFDSRTPTILFFGLIRKYKGLDVLLESLLTFSSNLQVIIAGECYGDFAPYQELINTLPGNIKVHLAQKFISDEDVPLYFSAADLCVLPYRSATQSGVTAVAHHFHVPVLATRVGGISEVVNDGVDGRLVDPENPEALRDAITEIFSKNEYQQMKENVKNSSRYTWDDFQEDSLQFFKSIL